MVLTGGGFADNAGAITGGTGGISNATYVGGAGGAGGTGVYVDRGHSITPAPSPAALAGLAPPDAELPGRLSSSAAPAAR